MMPSPSVHFMFDVKPTQPDLSRKNRHWSCKRHNIFGFSILKDITKNPEGKRLENIPRIPHACCQASHISSM